MSSRSELTTSPGEGALLRFGVGVDVANLGFFGDTSLAQGKMRGMANLRGHGWTVL
jgi:hypothetical protein